LAHLTITAITRRPVYELFYCSSSGNPHVQQECARGNCGETKGKEAILEITSSDLGFE
jgi:hypothetical protein